jgi:beta-glucosidase
MFSLTHRAPRRAADELIAEAGRPRRRHRGRRGRHHRTRRAEGFDRKWFPGREGGAALADVLLGDEEPGGRLPTTWPVALEDAPVTEVTPTEGQLAYNRGVFIGCRAWDRAAATPAYPSATASATPPGSTSPWKRPRPPPRCRCAAPARARGRETVQVYLAPQNDSTERPARWLVGFASVEAAPGEAVEVEIPLRRRTFEIWDERADAWTFVPGTYEVRAGRSLTDVRLCATLDTRV